jgi:hypothetical protein
VGAEAASGSSAPNLIAHGIRQLHQARRAVRRTSTATGRGIVLASGMNASSDPLRLVWDALAARDYRPHGKAYDFRARCPGHNGTNRGSLHVSVGADGRAVLWCFAHQCPVETITAALGLSVPDLYPAGHHRARRLSPGPVRRSDFHGVAADVANSLYALSVLEERWQLMLTSDCPYCGAQGAWLRADSTGNIDADCPDGCDAHRYTGALLGELRGRAKQRAG